MLRSVCPSKSGPFDGADWSPCPRVPGAITTVGTGSWPAQGASGSRTVADAVVTLLSSLVVEYRMRCAFPGNSGTGSASVTVPAVAVREAAWAIPAEEAAGTAAKASVQQARTRCRRGGLASGQLVDTGAEKPGDVGCVGGLLDCVVPVPDFAQRGHVLQVRARREAGLRLIVLRQVADALADVR